jgi:uncharacterized Zn finger protein
MGPKAAPKDSFKKLTWHDLEDWAGSTIVSRGQNYQRSRYVQELARTPDGALVAWVQGTDRYATLVDFDEGELASVCTCPYGFACKHAVAVVLEYLHLLKQKKEILEVGLKDRRLSLVAEPVGEEDWDEDDEEEDEEREYLELSHPVRSRKSVGPSIPSFLEKQTKENLLSLLKGLAERFPAVREALKDQSTLESGNVKNMVSAARREILEVSSEPGWRNNWSGEGHTPDYSGVKHRLEALLAKGHADEVVSLGKGLFDFGKAQVEMSHDEGETAIQISSCMDLVFQALSQSSLSPLDQMLWAVNVELEDEYELCHGAESFWKKKQRTSDWSILADRLLERLNTVPAKKGEDKFSSKYQRDNLSNWVIQALEKAGRTDEVIPLCEREAEITGDYPRLVEWLRRSKRFKDAEEWIERGMKATRGKWPGIASGLRNVLREMRENEGNWPQAASFRAEDFFQDPSLATYKELQKAAQKAKVWPEVRSAAMIYLETGKHPAKLPSWPLPETGAEKIREVGQISFPVTEALIDIAMAEKRTDDVLHWYDLKKTRKTFWMGDVYGDDEIASAVADQYPDRAVEIWKNIAENEISLTKPKAYESAAVYLRKAQKLMAKVGKREDWRKYINGLRRANEKKRRFVEILERLEDRSILGTEKK